MKNANNNSLFQKILNVVKIVLDGLIISIFIALPLILIAGAINAIFGLESRERIGIGLTETVGLGNDFGLVLRLVLFFAAVGGVLALIRHPVTIWNWLKPRPLAAGGLLVLLITLIGGWLVLEFRPTPAERLATAVTETSVSQVERVLASGGVDQDFINVQLSRSIEEGKFEIANTLIEAGADINHITDFRESPLLIFAILFYDKPSIEFLLERSVDPNQTDDVGQTALVALIASRMLDGDLSQAEGVEIAEALLLLGVDPLQEDDFGQSAKDYAESRELTAFLALFP